MIGSQTEFSLQGAICAWCEPVERGVGLGTVSHGICLKHLRKLKLQTQGLLPKRARRSARPDSQTEALLPL